MQYTTHYNLNLPEGTDVVNPLVQDNPNYTAIDAAMFANKQAVIGTASEVTSGTAHAITRSNPDSNYFRFTATSNWTAGDTMSVDGVPVSVFLSDGQTPESGAYVINSEVLCLISGSRVTLITSGKQTAAQTTYANSVSGLSATDVQDAIDEIVSNTRRLKYDEDTIAATTVGANSIINFTHAQGKFYLACALVLDVNTNIWLVGNPYFRTINGNWTVTVLNTAASSMSIEGKIRWYYYE